MNKIRVLFPYVEAGFGHIMPLRSLEESFRRKYGDKTEIISSDFFTESGDPHLIRYEKMISRQVRIYNRLPPVGFTGTAMCEFFGTALSSFGSMQLISPVAFLRGVRRMKELDADVVVSTHWVTNYYAEHLNNKPLTVTYCPDAVMNKLFQYRCDLTMISMPIGFDKAIRLKRYNSDNLKLVPFCIRNEAFSLARDKRELRRRLGIPENNFTVLLAEGGYGIGKMEQTVKMLIRQKLPLTVIAVCGTNNKLYSRLTGMIHSEEVTFMPCAFAENILEYQAASDLFIGKSGNILAESTFFGNPSIVTHFANMIERNIATHYINTVGCTVKEFSTAKVVRMIRDFISDPSLLTEKRENAKKYHDNFGSEQAADEIWKLIGNKYPDRISQFK